MELKSKIRRYWAKRKFPTMLIVASVHLLVMYLIFSNSDFQKTEHVRKFQPFLLLDGKPFRSSSLDKQRIYADPISLFNVTDFKLIVNQPEICDNRPDLRSIVIIHTAPKHFVLRNAIRRTWASQLSNVVPVVFLVGQTEHTEHQKRLNEEILARQDVIQGSFIDHYHNLTYKYLMGLLWTRIYCRQVSVILKGDDDIFVNMPRYLNLVDELQKTGRNEGDDKMLTCYEVVDNGVVRRSANSKWNVPLNEYPHSNFPKYCPGAVVILNKRAIDDILDSVNQSPYVWVDDAYVTGVLADAGRVQPKKLNESHICRRLPHNANKTLMKHFKQAAFGPLQLSIKEIYRLWSVLHEN